MGCTLGYKVCVILLAVFQVAVAAALVAPAIIIFFSFDSVSEFAQSTHVLIPAAITLAASAVLAIVGVIGVFAAVSESKCCLSFFFILCAGICLIEFGGGISALVYRYEFENLSTTEFNRMIAQYNQSKTIADEVNWVQRTLACCGSNNATDWANLNLTVPDSCCQSFNSTLPKGHCTEKVVENAGLQGCGKKLHDSFFVHMDIIGGVVLAVGCVQTFALIASLCWICKRSEHYNIFY